MEFQQIHFTTQIENCTNDTIAEKLLADAQQAAKRAYAPYSKFRVGAAALLENGEIISGNNQENSAYPSGLCAERVTVFFANSKYPDIAITHLLIYAETDEGALKKPITPCGACRQVLIETETRQQKNIKIYLAGANTIYSIDSAADLLPLSFLPD